MIGVVTLVRCSLLICASALVHQFSHPVGLGMPLAPSVGDGAFALRLPEIWQFKVQREPRRTWGIDWFTAHGLDADEQRDLLQRFARMRAWFA